MRPARRRPARRPRAALDRVRDRRNRSAGRSARWGAAAGRRRAQRPALLLLHVHQRRAGKRAANVPSNAVTAGPVECGTPHNQIPVALPNGIPGLTTGRKLYRGDRRRQWRDRRAWLRRSTTTTRPSTWTRRPPSARRRRRRAPIRPARPPKRCPVVNIPIGPGNTTGRRLYRRFNGAGTVEAGHDAEQQHRDDLHRHARRTARPGRRRARRRTRSGTAVQQVPLTAIPIGPLGVTARKLYRRFNGVGFYLVHDDRQQHGDHLHRHACPTPPAAPATRAPIPPSGIRLPSRASRWAPARSPPASSTCRPSSGAARRLALTLGDNVTTSATITMSDADARRPGAGTRHRYQRPAAAHRPGEPRVDDAPPGGGDDLPARWRLGGPRWRSGRAVHRHQWPDPRRDTGQRAGRDYDDGPVRAAGDPVADAPGRDRRAWCPS